MALRVWLPLNGNIENKGSCSLVSSGTPTFLDNGKIGKCISLTPRVSFTGMPEMKQFTILFWLKVDSCSVDWADSLCFNTRKTDGTAGTVFRFEATKTTRACSFHNNADYAITEASRILITEAQKGEWHHCGFSYDGANCYTYIDGVLTYTDTGLGGTILDYLHIGETNNIVGGMNDLRVYDECLSDKQIKEISKGLICHYKLDNSYIETVINLAPGINDLTTYTTDNSPAWDTTLNGTPMIYPSGWGYGYNSGVPDPTHGYHAHWIRENGQWEMIFPNLNSVISQKGRWLGISAGGLPITDILAGEKYTISWWQKTDNLSLAAFGGIYYKKTSDGTNNFWDGYPIFGYNTKLNTWEYMTHTFTRISDYVENTQSQSIYVYGYNSTYEGTVYVKDVQIVRGDHPLPYAVGTRNGLTYEQDCSGNEYTVTKSGTLTFNIDSPKYSGSTYFNGSSYMRSDWGSMTWFNFDNITISAWMKPTVAPSGWTGSIGMQHDGGLTGKTFIISNYGGKFTVHAVNNTTWDEATISSETLPLNTWSYCVATLENGSNLKMYINGELVKTTTIDYKTATVNNDTCIGIGVDFPGSDEKYTGYYSDIRIYATALSNDDIKKLYNRAGFIDNKQNVYAYEFKEE